MANVTMTLTMSMTITIVITHLPLAATGGEQFVARFVTVGSDETRVSSP
jgi:hypothetical protein